MKIPSIFTMKKLSFAALAVWLTAIYTGSAATVLFVGPNGGGGNDNWSTSANFLNVASPFAPTTPANNAANFNFLTQAAAPGVVTLNVDGGYGTPGSGAPQAWGMIFGETNGYQTVVIQPGLVFSMMAANATEGGGGLCVCPTGTNSGGGTGGNSPPITYTNYTTILGTNATFYVNGTLRVEAGEANGPANHYSILDLSHLDTFIQTNTTPTGTGDWYVAGGGTQRSQALMYLAKTNYITPNSAIQIGYLGGTYSNSLPIGVYLGQTNYIAPGSSATFALGYVGCTNAFMQFNPMFLGGPTPPAAYLAANNGALMNQVLLGDPANGKVSGMATCDFTGGNVTWLANNFQIGVTATNVNAQGVLTFDNGIISARQFIVGYQQSSFTNGGGFGSGIINVNSNSAYATNATLTAVTSLTLGQVSGVVTTGTAGTINLNGGVLNASSIVTAGGVGTVNMTNAGWVVAIPTAGGTNMAVTAFNAGGATNIITLTSITPLLGGSFPVRFHLIAAASITGASTLGLGPLPASYDLSHPYAGHLDTTSSPGYVDFVLTGGPATARVLTWSGTNSGGNPDGDWDVGLTADWLTNGVATIYNQFDVANFYDVTAPAATNINLTTALTPLGVIVSNTASLYTIRGSGSLSGATGLIKQGTGALILDNTAANNFTGGVMISGGLLQVGAN
ncbi:MAG TPA: autotransporter-associated beta strand repeat-containing protein, partial [Candidatus Saccharimonadales bacterium]|nr:autotransporter-associated beta strand repeat-containing protein [Candidatus Saccharimonadales bacterium]